MTIFLKVAHVVIHDTINTIKNEAETANKRPWATYTRDIAVSEAKCAQLKKLLEELGTVKDGPNDKATRDALQALILRYQDVVNAARGTEHSEGTTESVLKCLLIALPSIYHELERRPLLNITYDTHPFNQFRYAIALFSARKIVRDNMPGVKPAQLLASGRSFTAAQEELVQKALNDGTGSILLQEEMARKCTNIVHTASNSKYSYKRLRAELVLHHFTELKEANTTLHSQFLLSYVHSHQDKVLLDECLVESESALRKALLSEHGREEPLKFLPHPTPLASRVTDKLQTGQPELLATSRAKREDKSDVPEDTAVPVVTHGLEEVDKPSVPEQTADIEPSPVTEHAKPLASSDTTTSTGLMLAKLATDSDTVRLEEPNASSPADLPPPSVPNVVDGRPSVAAADNPPATSQKLTKSQRKKVAAGATTPHSIKFG